ncbi:glycosyltransferase family 2 protein [Aeromicrobium yanjiei]|uniref:Glycosyltransferase n=1 Tax=Aeromicrobium yanjiei TaxID=2662028 RepID=A0A5Q2MNB3_9ACTN|nr:glycosyltransferase family A protein [Aeromicrobium yanjiei]QGG42756.1 glycosyltransferase [Aeromicrobium yanjiei]
MHRVRRALRRVVATPLDRWRQRDLPVLSVVVPVYNGAEHLDEALRSIRRQDYRRIDVVVIDDGSTDGSLAIARRHARADRRLTVLSQPNAGVGAARRAAVAAATGTYLTFVDADDTVTRGGIRAAMDGLSRSGSDLAVMPYQRLERTGIKPPAPWIRALHARPATHTSLSERPDVLVNAIACAKIFRRSFWDAQALEFPEVLLAGDQIVTARAYRDADGIDITSVVAYSWRRMDSSISQGQVTAQAVHARFDAIDAVLELLEDLPDVRAERALQYLRYNVPNSTLKLERADDAYLDALFERVPRVVGAAPADRYAAEVPAQHRVLNTLLAARDRDAVWRFVQAEGMQPEMHPSGQEPAGLTVYLPGWGVDDVPPEAYVLTDEQTVAKAIVREVRHEGADLVLDVAAWFGNVELEQPTLTVKTDGDLVDVVHGGQPYVVTSRQGAQRRYAGSAWVVTLHGAGRRAPGTLTVTLRDRSRSGTVTARIPRS